MFFMYIQCNIYDISVEVDRQLKGKINVLKILLYAN